MKYIVLLLLSTFLISCGHDVTSTGSPVSSQSSTVYLVSDRKLEGQEVHQAIASELGRMHYKVIDLKDDKARKVNGLVVHYHDVWGWDLVMLIRSMDIRIVDGQTGKTLSTTSYKQKATWPYPEVETVVADMFTEIRAKKMLH